MAITEFRGEYAFLSNFYYCKVIYAKHEYITSEHAYQASKTGYPEQEQLEMK